MGPGVNVVPFTLAGDVHGCIVRRGGAPLPLLRGRTQTVDLSFVGSGIVRMHFGEAATDPRLLQLEVVRYEVGPVPEPSTLLLLAGGATALGARARSRRSAG